MMHEIELKALLTEGQYSNISKKLVSELKLINKETVHTTRYRPGDIRLRFSDKMFEMVEKQGDPTHGSRKEKVTKIKNREAFEFKKTELEKKGYKADPSWITHKQEFIYQYNGFEYTICLQHTENFAYILEVEFMSKEKDNGLHEPNIRAIMLKLGLEPIVPEDFNRKIQEYIEANKK